MFAGVPDEQERLVSVYAGYAESDAKVRAWRSPGTKLMLDEVLDALRRHAGAQLHGPGRVLEIGCGTGTWLARLSAAGVANERLHGVDIQPEAVAEAREKVPGASVAVGDALALDLPDGHFSLVVLFVVLSSMPDRPAAAQALREARRVTAPGGALAVYDMRLPSPNPHVWRVGRRWLKDNLGPRTELHSLTVLPPLARRIGERAPKLYPVAGRVPFLRSHLLAIHRAA
jgi:ubiquinone/menaquinone biosynthesis C-methylase UbiE